MRTRCPLCQCTVEGEGLRVVVERSADPLPRAYEFSDVRDDVGVLLHECKWERARLVYSHGAFV